MSATIASVADVESPKVCPRCTGRLARLGDEPPWCQECEWNLGSWRPSDKRSARAAERGRARSFELNAELIRELSGSRPDRPKATRTRLILRCASYGLLLFDLALLLGGAYLLVVGPGNLRVVGFLMVLIGIECRIRFPKIKSPVGRITAAESPALIDVIEQVRTAISAPRVPMIFVDNGWNAACGRSGLRRRAYLVLGLPMWASLSPEGRLALLGHELGHLVNGDPTTSFTTQPALTTFARLADIFDPRNLPFDGRTVWDLVAAPFVYVIFWPAHATCRWASGLLSRVGARDHQRAEVFADALATRVAGTAGATELAELLLFRRTAIQALSGAVADGAGDAEAWRAAVSRAVAERRSEFRTVEQLSLRHDASAYETHPPAGLRHRLVCSWPPTPAVVDAAALPFAAADHELKRYYERTRRSVVNSMSR